MIKTTLEERLRYKRVRRTQKIENLVRRLRGKVEYSNISLRVVVGLLKDLAGKPEIEPILKAINSRN